MKRYIAILLVTAFAASLSQHALAHLTATNRYAYRDYLDLQAVATAFSRSDNVSEFEYRLNDNRNMVSNLDLNNDGFIDYLRVDQFYDQGEHIIQVQAVLSRNYHQSVATIFIGRDRYNNEYIQIVGDESIYGYDYVLEPIFRRRPVIIRWIWDFNSPRYVSPYYWGYYPRHYKVRHRVALPSYHNRVRRYVDTRDEYRRIERTNRPAVRDYNGQVDRRPEVQRNNETDRKQPNSQRPEVNTRTERRPEVRQPENRQPERRPEVRQSENRQPERRPEVRQPENRQPERKPEVTKPESNKSDKSSDRESVREAVRESTPAPQRSAPSTRSSERTSSSRESTPASSSRR